MLFPGLQFALENYCDITVALDSAHDRRIDLYFRNYRIFSVSDPTLKSALAQAELYYLACIAVGWPLRTADDCYPPLDLTAFDRWLTADEKSGRSIRWFQSDDGQILCLLSDKQMLISYAPGPSLATATQAALLGQTARD